MLGHVDMLAAVAWFGAVLLGNAAALAAAVGCFKTRHREIWLVIVSATALILGSITAALGFTGGGRLGAFAVLLVAPPLVAIASLARWAFLKPDPKAQPSAAANGGPATPTGNTAATEGPPSVN